MLFSCVDLTSPGSSPALGGAVMQRMCHEVAQQYNTSSTSPKALSARSALPGGIGTPGKAPVLRSAAACSAAFPAARSYPRASLHCTRVETARCPPPTLVLGVRWICVSVRLFGIDSSEGDLLLAFEAFIGTSCLSPSK